MTGLVVNARSLRRRATGVETYAGEMTARLPGASHLVAPPSWLPSLAGHIWEQCVLPGQVRTGELLWSPANSGPLRVTSQVLSLHDTFVLDFPEWFNRLYATWHRLLLPRLIRKVSKVLTVSEWSRRSILRRFPFIENRLAVISPGVDRRHYFPRSQNEVEGARRRYGLPVDYLLFIGTLEPRKNLSRLIQAWEQVRAEYPRVALILAGSLPRPWVHRKWPSAFCQEAARSSIRYLGYIPAKDLPALYSGARMLILPSLAEGFGMPALEALACGTPVIASRAGALPETVGDAGLFFEPQDVYALAVAIRQILNKRELCAELRQKGMERAEYFSWEESARQLARELEEVAL